MKHVSNNVRNIGIVFTLLLVLGITMAFVKTVAAEDVRQAVEAGNAKWQEAFNQGDAATVAALYTDDATLMPPNSEMIEGRQGIQDFWQGAIQSGLKDASLTTVSVHASGETAYEIGKFSLTAHAEGKDPQVVSGKYVVVWQKGGDGMWKLHVDIWNSSMPAQ
jgi:uncharacterized protein (TIGR02246 family)